MNPAGNFPPMLSPELLSQQQQSPALATTHGFGHPQHPLNVGMSPTALTESALRGHDAATAGGGGDGQHSAAAAAPGSGPSAGAAYSIPYPSCVPVVDNILVPKPILSPSHAGVTSLNGVLSGTTTNAGSAAPTPRVHSNLGSRRQSYARLSSMGGTSPPMAAKDFASTVGGLTSIADSHVETPSNTANQTASCLEVEVLEISRRASMPQSTFKAHLRSSSNCCATPTPTAGGATTIADEDPLGCSSNKVCGTSQSTPSNPPDLDVQGDSDMASLLLGSANAEFFSSENSIDDSAAVEFRRGTGAMGALRKLSVSNTASPAMSPCNHHVSPRAQEQFQRHQQTQQQHYGVGVGAASTPNLAMYEPPPGMMISPMHMAVSNNSSQHPLQMQPPHRSAHSRSGSLSFSSKDLSGVCGVVPVVQHPPPPQHGRTGSGLAAVGMPPSSSSAGGNPVDGPVTVGGGGDVESSIAPMPAALHH